jgi:hypothetical protein
MDNPQPKQWLPISWKVMAAYGWAFIFFAVMVPLHTYFVYPNQPLFTYAAADGKFTGLSWGQIMAFSPDLGRWIGLTMISMCAMMILGGILIVALAHGPYRKGERWAWKALLFATLVSLSYYVLISFATHLPKGLPFWVLPPGASGVGADWFIIIGLVWLYFGLWWPRKELVD